MSLKKKETSKGPAFNQYDESQADKIYSRIKKQKRKKAMIILALISILFLIGLYFNSEYALVGKITIKGNSFVSDYIIEQTIQIEETDYRISTYKKNIKKLVGDIPGVETVKIHNNPFQGLVIEITESKLIAFTKNGEQYQLIFEDGEICELQDISLLPEVQVYPLCMNFGDELETFAENFAKVRDTIRTQFSDIYYSNDPGDPRKITIYTNDGKTIYCRLNDMVNQINHYNDVLAEYPDFTVYDFIGDKVYMS